MRIGYACIPLGIDATTNRGFILRNFTPERFHEAVKANLEDLLRILEYNAQNNIYMFRISSAIIPFGSHESNDIKWWEDYGEELSSIGEFIREKSMRVSMHPGQYTILNSPSEEVVNRAVKDIEYHTRVLDTIGLDTTCKIVVHTGGVYGDKEASLRRFMDNLYRLSGSARRRLVIENDERCYTIRDVLDLCSSMGLPAVFDNLHHSLNPSMGNDIKGILKEVRGTWQEEDGPMKLHYSDQSHGKRNGAHSDFVDTRNFLEYFDIIKELKPDVMLEVKDKDISAIKCINASMGDIRESPRYAQWSKYEYIIMERGYGIYEKCSGLIKSGAPMEEFYRTVDHALNIEPEEESYKNTALHVWGHFKDKASKREKERFLELLDDHNCREKAKELLKKLAHKYDVRHITNSYYFAY